MDRADIPLWSIKRPGKYETRDGREAEVVGKFSGGYWVGDTDDDLMTWDDYGRQRVGSSREPSGDIIGPWIEGGLPFDCVLDPATADADLLRRFKDARKAGLVIEFKSKSASNQHWCVVQWPFFNGLGVYRLRGSTADWTPPQTTLMQPEQITYPKIESVTTPEPVSLTEHQLQQVREIVAAALYNWWLRAGMPADWRPEQ